MFPTPLLRGCFAEGVLLVTLIAGFPHSGAARNRVFPGRQRTTAVLAIKDGELAAAVYRAVRGAARRLEQSSCAAVLGSFADAGGRPRRDVLASLALTPAESFSRIVFGTAVTPRPAGAPPAVAFTGPGSRVVFVWNSLPQSGVRGPRRSSFTRCSTPWVWASGPRHRRRSTEASRATARPDARRR